MKTIHTIALVSLALLFSLGLVCAQSPSRPKTNWEITGQGWLTNYYGKTLSSLGEIVSVKIEPASKATTPPANSTAIGKTDPADRLSTSSTNRAHTAVWTAIEHSKLQDYYSRSVALHIPPVFTVEYADGTRVHATRHTASIRWADGREGLFVLAEGSANKSAAANRRSAFQSDGSGNLSATVAADRVFPSFAEATEDQPAAVAELGR